MRTLFRTPSHARTFSAILLTFCCLRITAEQWKNDPRNPYREQIAQEEVAHH